MSKPIKQMEMSALKDTFKGVRDMVVMTIKGLDGNATTSFRATLRKKKVRLQVIKNSLARKVFDELGIKISPESPYWLGPTTLAFGADSVAELSKAVESELKDLKKAPIYKDKVVIKGAVADGLEVPFAVALKMPTRGEALSHHRPGLAPASRLVSQLLGPGASLASQLKTISEKAPAAEAPAEGTPAPETPPEAAPQPA